MVVYSPTPWHARPRCSLRWILGCLLAFSTISLAFAQEKASLQIGAPPYYAGIPVELLVIAEGFAEAPQPSIETPTIQGATLTLVRVTPSVSTSMSIVNGQVTHWKRVRFGFRYRLEVAKPTRITMPRFIVTQGSKSATTVPTKFDFEAIPKSEAHRIELQLPESAVLPGERIPIALEWWLPESSADKVTNRRARVPLFERIDAFQFEFPKVGNRRGPTLVVDTPTGPLELQGDVRRERADGKRFLVVRFEQTMIPLTPGTYDVPGSSIVVEEAVRFSRDFLRGRVPRQTRRLSAEDTTRTLTVRAPPEEGRPTSFAGAVGQGFSIRVRADRTIVQAGDPIRLKVSIQGDTNLDSVSLPSLAQAGLSPDSFRVPAGDITGTVSGNTKEFDVTVRVVGEHVDEIPALAFSWFDVVQNSYQTARSEPIALSVRKANVVSATDVVRNAQTPVAETEVATPTADGAATRSEVSATAEFSLGGANLSIVTDLTRLATNPESYGHKVEIALYLLGGCALALGGFARRRRNTAPSRARTQARDTLLDSIRNASTASEIARIVRTLTAEQGDRFTEAQHRELDGLLRECDDLSFAPGGASDAATDETKRRATEWAREVAL